MLLRNMLGQLCLVTKKSDFVHQDYPEREKTIGIHFGYNKKPPLYGHKNVSKKVKKKLRTVYFWPIVENLCIGSEQILTMSNMIERGCESEMNDYHIQIRVPPCC